MPFTLPNKVPQNSSLAMTPPNGAPKGTFSVSPNLKEISETIDLDTPEKVSFTKVKQSRHKGCV